MDRMSVVRVMGWYLSSLHCHASLPPTPCPCAGLFGDFKPASDLSFLPMTVYLAHQEEFLDPCLLKRRWSRYKCRVVSVLQLLKYSKSCLNLMDSQKFRCSSVQARSVQGCFITTACELLSCLSFCTKIVLLSE